MGDLVLHLRDEGHVLSSMDQHLIATWWERGYPLPTVLRTVRDTGERLKKRKRPPRGLPLKSMSRQVERDGGRAVTRAAAAAPGDVGPDGLWHLRVARDRVLAALGDRGHGHRSARALKGADASLSAALAEPDSGGAFVTLLRVARTYYDALVSAAPSGERAALRSEITASLGDVRRMAPDAVDATVSELLRRRMQEQDPVLDVRRIEEDAQ